MSSGLLSRTNTDTWGMPAHGLAAWAFLWECARRDAWEPLIGTTEAGETLARLFHGLDNNIPKPVNARVDYGSLIT